MEREQSHISIAKTGDPSATFKEKDQKSRGIGEEGLIERVRGWFHAMPCPENTAAVIGLRAEDKSRGRRSRGEFAGDLSDDYSNIKQLAFQPNRINQISKKRKHTVQTNNREDESQTQHQDNNRVHPQTGALVSVQLEHGTRRATGTRRASRAGPGVPQRLLVVGGGTAAHGSARAAGGSGRGGTADGRAGGNGAGASAGGLGVGAGLGA